MIDDGSELIRRAADATGAADVKEHRQFRPEGWMVTLQRCDIRALFRFNFYVNLLFLIN